ncbi:hypothetical protein EXD82_03775 [Peptacetobacter hominis]|uniref:PpiC domain-containing protein n=1 Tax=Peptacetobacter hominis TaxID=2743610 RepID=A0A544QWA6_9FIRM|nr:peptidylprolyl isomerase [Peptacetobacter hominis]TQQ84972.1 hypothetical protein EXD82_03775 [Peptacetobacter hominis]
MKKRVIPAIFLAACIIFTGCSNKNVAKVNDTEISKDDFETTKNIVAVINEYNTGKSLEDMSEEELSDFDSEIITFMIDRRLISQKAIENGINVSSEESSTRAGSIKEGLESNTILKEKLSKKGITEQELENFATEDILSEKYREAFDNSQNVKESDISEYYNTHSEEFEQEYVEASHILISTINNDGTAMSEEQKKEKRELANQIAEKAKNGEDFSTLAKQYSDDKKTGANGGNLGFFKKSDKDSAFTGKVFELKKGEISDVIETNSGYEIVKVTNRKTEKSALNKEKENIKKSILDDRYIKHLEELEKDADIKIF